MISLVLGPVISCDLSADTLDQIFKQNMQNMQNMYISYVYYY